jgi:two-component system nitrate/nitrite response regulator NarL
MHKIVLIDDHRLFRIAIVNIIQKEEDLEITEEFSNYQDAYASANIELPSIYIIDLKLGDYSGFDFVQKMKSKYPDVKLVILSMYKQEFYLIQAINYQIDGYIHKDAEPNELVSGIRKVLNGEKFYSKEISEILINKVYSQVTRVGESPSLSAREKEIIKYIADGLNSKEIAKSLFLSVRTIETHRSRILHKLGLKNTAELVRLAIIENIV